MTEFLNDLERFWNANHEWLWIALGVLVAIVVIGALIGWSMSKKRDMDRRHAAAIREDAARRSTRIGEKDAETRRVEAEAEQAQAEADRLHALARERREQVDRERRVYEERLGEADKLDRGRRHHGAHR